MSNIIAPNLPHNEGKRADHNIEALIVDMSSPYLNKQYQLRPTSLKSSGHCKARKPV